MKIEILSMQDVNNYGSVLQAYSLKKLVSFYNNEVFFLKVNKCKNANSNIIRYVESEKTIKINKYIVNNIFQVLNRRKLRDVYSSFRKTELKNIEYNCFDLCIIGSDEVFNCLQDTSWGTTMQLFGDVHNAKKIITYAASCGYTKYEFLTEELKNDISKNLNNLEAISVRDNNTFDFVNKVAGIKPLIHMDPVVIGNFDNEIERAAFPKNLKNKYCIIYSYRNRIYKKEDIKRIKEFCEMKGLEIISLGSTQKWIKKHLYINPFELLKVFKNSSYVITDTFHGAIFSAKYASKVAIMIKDSNRNKLGDLVSRLKIEDHVISSFDELNNNYSIELNRKAIDDIIEKERVRALDYLRKYTNEQS